MPDFDELKAKRDKLKVARDIKNLERRAKLDEFFDDPIAGVRGFFSDVNQVTSGFVKFILVILVIFALGVVFGS